MPVTIQFDLPEDTLMGLEGSPATFVRELRLAAAVKWYEVGRLSQGKAAELAGVSREAFHEALARYDVSAFQLTPDDLRDELQGLS
ncbi:MAG: UPF0175 family protein [Bacteroidota bacterium]